MKRKGRSFSFFFLRCRMSKLVFGAQAPICISTSGDGSLGELSGLWLQEDNLMVVTCDWRG